MIAGELTMNFDSRYTLCIEKLYHRPHFTVGGSWNKNIFNTQERSQDVPPAHASWGAITPSRTRSRCTQ